jgi:hypothetical protein
MSRKLPSNFKALGRSRKTNPLQRNYINNNVNNNNSSSNTSSSSNIDNITGTDRPCNKSKDKGNRCCRRFKVIKGTNGSQGKQGKQGDPGLTPYIGDNGNWWIDDTDTGVSATCKCGGTTSACSIENDDSPDTLYVSVCDKTVGIENVTPNGFIVYDKQQISSGRGAEFPYYTVDGNQLWFNVKK